MRSSEVAVPVSLDGGMRKIFFLFCAFLEEFLSAFLTGADQADGTPVAFQIVAEDHAQTKAHAPHRTQP